MLTVHQHHHYHDELDFIFFGMTPLGLHSKLFWNCESPLVSQHVTTNGIMIPNYRHFWGLKNLLAGGLYMSHLTCLGFQYHVFGILNIYLHANFGEFNTFFFFQFFSYWCVLRRELSGFWSSSSLIRNVIPATPSNPSMVIPPGMVANPSLMREMTRNADRALGQLDAMPGGDKKRDWCISHI